MPSKYCGYGRITNDGWNNSKQSDKVSYAATSDRLPVNN
jgi:hypothetical protein